MFSLSLSLFVQVNLLKIYELLLWETQCLPVPIDYKVFLCPGDFGGSFSSFLFTLLPSCESVILQCQVKSLL